MNALAKIGDEFRVNTTTFNSQYDPAITTLTDGRFVVTWENWYGAHDDTSGHAVTAQMFHPEGTKSGDEFLVNTTTKEWQSDPAIAPLSDGRFVVAWTDWSRSEDNPSDAAVRAQIFNPDGSKVGGESLVNTTTYFNQAGAAITALTDGRFVVTWNDASRTGGDASNCAVRPSVYQCTKEDTDFPNCTAISHLSSCASAFMGVDHRHSIQEVCA